MEVVRAWASLHPRMEGTMPTWSPHPAGWSPHLEAGRRNKVDRAWAPTRTCPGLSQERDKDILSFGPYLGDTLFQQQTFALKAKVLYKPLPSCHRKSGSISSHFSQTRTHAETTSQVMVLQSSPFKRSLEFSSPSPAFSVRETFP